MSLAVTGLKEIQAALEELNRKGVHGALKVGCRAGARVILKAARRRAKTLGLSGALERSLIIVTKARRGSGKVNAYVGPKVGRSEQVTVDEKWGKRSLKRWPAKYVHLVEYGAQPHTIVIRTKKGGKRQVQHPGAKPKPFLRPAMDEAKAAAMEAFKTKTFRAVEKQLKKGNLRGT